MSILYADVAVDDVQPSFDKLYAYKIPDEYADIVKAGMRVLVPFGNSKKPRTAIVFCVSNEVPQAKRIKSVSRIIDKTPILNDEMLKLALWLKERTFCTVYDAVKAILPSGLNYKMIVSYMITGDVNDSADINYSHDEGEVLKYLQEKQVFCKRKKILADLGFNDECTVLEDLYKKGCLTRNFDSVRRVGDSMKKMIRLFAENDDDFYSELKLSAKQESVVKLLQDVGSASLKEVCYFTGVTVAVPNALVGKGIAEIYESEVFRTPFEAEDGEMTTINLSDVQNKAYIGLKKLAEEDKSNAALLYGVTGSGKTQVFLKLIDDCILKNKDVIVMVPEISLTPQTISIFKQRYGKKIAVFHSALSIGERADEFKRVLKGEASIAIGTRSAVFAPMKNLGLIIIDEEQEHTYKSENSPRYHARDVAKFRCSYNNCLLILASATPCIETYAKAKSGLYSLFEMNERFGNAVLPKVVTVDLTEESGYGEKTFISSVLLDELKQNVEDGYQSIILLNRRGYNTFVACKKCGNVVTCPNCSISMTYHSVNGKLMCHYCGYSTPLVNKCEVCGADNMRYNGVGTQKIEEDLHSLIPDARILRMDADSTMSRMSYENSFERFSKGEYDIMLGTQMVAKGLDFENVTLVGVVSADQQLHNDDYRSSERTFSLLTQVIGRSGRGEYNGKAIIQTYTPDNEIIKFAEKQDYKAFFDYEIRIRKMMVYPPYCDICVIGFVGEKEVNVYHAATEFFTLLKEKTKEEFKNESIIALGPVPLKIAKVGNKYRYRLILKCHNSKRFRSLISSLLNDYYDNSKKLNVTVFADINPETML